MGSIRRTSTTANEVCSPLPNWLASKNLSLRPEPGHHRRFAADEDLINYPAAEPSRTGARFSISVSSRNELVYLTCFFFAVKKSLKIFFQTWKLSLLNTKLYTKIKVSSQEITF